MGRQLQSKRCVPRRPPPPRLVPKPELPLHDENLRSFMLENGVQELLDSAITEDKPISTGYGPLDLLAAIDPVTGDSVVHRAASVGNTRFLSGILGCWGKRCGNDKRPLGSFWVLMMHQNLAGDTALHVAARHGSLQGAKAVYRLLHHDWVHDEDHNDENPPADEWEWDFKEDLIFVYKAVIFVCAKNKDGLDAAALAQESRNNVLIKWFEDLLQKIDPDGKRNDDSYIKGAWAMVLEYYGYYINDIVS
ncbi:hypothetical protein TMatcc_007311 [Talaromyces marneffei ATCC 18224]|uniref:Ankyrin repeat protein n=1 Tax=Talaromyces marneffei (strain ATCC 18224 / CBS 334.59 / QM 7333) TaxID=441960 RepID=B6QFK2_TALMQ|nr:uncharacterized protein EYB26_004286 [Talaromyces marneffei]EEA24237.1 hypothetical protein PMAA_082430 [Talaromyces marneffei ATCC 18224]KAE8553252.1 hypothetical protein EYB25_004634 [Talaromyces marneffei]QGA16619.1 hypothetical protein EYB26_004286 [Talaromyces marneffei]